MREVEILKLCNTVKSSETVTACTSGKDKARSWLEANPHFREVFIGETQRSCHGYRYKIQS